MKKPALYSAIFHIIVFAVILLGLPLPSFTPPVNEQPVIMEFENIGPISTAPVLTPETNIKEAQQKPQKQPEPPKEEPETKEKPTEAQPQRAEEKPVKEEPKVEEKPEPKKEKQPDAESIPDPVKKPEPKKEEKKPEKKPDPKKDKKDPKKKEDKKEKKNDKAEVNLDPKKKQKSEKTKKDSKNVDDLVNSLINDSVSDAASKGAPASRTGDTVTATDIDAIRSKIYKCWLLPAGAKDAKDLVVDIRMDIAQDGTVTKAEIVNKDRMSDPYFQAAAESAQRAVLDPACNPLPLPQDKYDKWKRLTLRFNPKDMY